MPRTPWQTKLSVTHTLEKKSDPPITYLMIFYFKLPNFSLLKNFKKSTKIIWVSLYVFSLFVIVEREVDKQKRHFIVLNRIKRYFVVLFIM